MIRVNFAENALFCSGIRLNKTRAYMWLGAEGGALAQLALVHLPPPPSFFIVVIQQPGSS